MSDFTLIETMRYDPPEEGTSCGIKRQRLHMARLQRSAGRLGFRLPGDLAERLDKILRGRTTAHRVRLELFPDGRTEIVAAAFTPQAPETVWTVRIARTRLSSTDPLLRYKTSRRGIYEAARAEWTSGEADEVLLLNEHGDPCEGTITSLFFDDGSGQLKTPPIASGLLAGVLRTELICARRARVERLTLERVAGGRIFMGNALRGLIPARLIGI